MPTRHATCNFLIAVGGWKDDKRNVGHRDRDSRDHHVFIASIQVTRDGTGRRSQPRRRNTTGAGNAESRRFAGLDIRLVVTALRSV